MPFKAFESGISQKGETAQSNVAEYPGICMTCNYAPTCAHRMRQKEPVLFCEQFDDYQPAIKKMTLASPPRVMAGAKKESSGIQGLCANCENLETCNLNKPEDGVWHCEEYS